MLINHQQTNRTMKKIIFLLAVAGMFAFAACNSGSKTETTAGSDTTVVTTTTTTAVDSTVTSDTVKK
jgi:ABC-type glycerol-3-phosphate transport system substrate-binding protein